ncbi:MAG TPA: hypothetical protein VHX14_01135 [Thermoanaerobaculia bacterium]|jgi:hypothetical protein|nr:hypothetical protein [Thermoanaerobaculia bacterium]
MKTLARSLIVSLALSLAVSLYAAPVAPAITFDTTHVIASGFQSGRDIIIFGVGMGPGPYFLRLLRYTETVVADSSGAVRFEIANGVPDRSVWFAVDAQTRDYAAGSPRPGLLRPTLNGPGVRHGAQGGADSIDLDRRLMDILVARPGSGVWVGSCGRNSLKDLNRGKSGAMQLSAGELTAAPKSTGRLSTILPSDLIVVIDSETLEYFVGSPRQL